MCGMTAYIYIMTVISLDLKNIKELLLRYILTINMFWIIISSQYYPNCLTKELFLCPMTKREQKSYLLRHYREKIIWNMLITIGFCCLFVAAKYMHILGMILLVVSQLLINLTSHLYIDTSEIQRAYRSRKHVLKGYEISRIIMVGVGGIAWIIILFYAIEASSKLSIGMLIIISIQVLASLYFLKVYSKPLFEYGMNSEEMSDMKVPRRELRK